MIREMNYDEFMNYAEFLIMGGHISSTDKDHIFWEMMGHEHPKLSAEVSDSNKYFEDFINDLRNKKRNPL